MLLGESYEIIVPLYTEGCFVRLATQIPRVLCGSRFALCRRYAKPSFRCANEASSLLGVKKMQSHHFVQLREGYAARGI